MFLHNATLADLSCLILKGCIHVIRHILFYKIGIKSIHCLESASSLYSVFENIGFRCKIICTVKISAQAGMTRKRQEDHRK